MCHPLIHSLRSTALENLRSEMNYGGYWITNYHNVRISEYIFWIKKPISKLFSIFKPKYVTHMFTHFVQHTSALENLRLDMYYAASELLTIRMLTLLNYFFAFKN